MKKRILSVLLVVCMLAGMLPTVAFAAEPATEPGHFQSQLLTDDARTIYKAFDGMNLAGGVETVTLSGVQTDSWDALFADFVAAKDAYMLDHNLFYVDFDKMTLTQKGNTVTMGVGREATYFHDGFDANNVGSAINAFDTKVAAIAAAAKAKKTMQEQIKAAYDAVIDSCSYALEADVKTEGNELYVRTAYGALVRGEAVCSGYAEALKAVLDEMGVENVTVWGTYEDNGDFNNNGITQESHMWNYVRMDDHRWYMLDATMADSNHAEDFFLVTGLDEQMKAYQPNGVISLSADSMEFSYPDLSIKEYEVLSDAFQVNEDGSISYIDNDGTPMGIIKAQSTVTMEDENGKDQPIYILASFDGGSWYYYERYLQAMVASMSSEDPTNIDITVKQLGSLFDTENSFLNFSNHAYFGITTIAPTAVYELGKLKEYYIYQSGLDNVHDISIVDKAIDFAAIPPYITTKIPYNSRLDQGKPYKVEVVYSEALQKSNPALDVDITWVREVNGGSIADFKWWGDDDVPANQKDATKVTFTLTTGVNFGSTTNYYFELQNLSGVNSHKAPNAIGFCTYNNNTFDCPKVDWDVSKIHSNTPVLIATDDLSTEGWTDKDGNPLENLPKRLSLVATTIEDQGENTEKSDMIDEIEKTLGDGAVKAAQTYDISLSLCSGQVAYLDERPVQVYVPFPAGYSYNDFKNGSTTFKAYHFDKNGNPEEIKCEVVEGGIIMYCTSFSPFAVIAMETPKHEHNWATEWSGDETAHWHECTVDDCDVTENSGKDGYAVHTASDDDGDCTTAVTCTTCSRVLTEADKHNFTVASEKVDSKATCEENQKNYAKCANCTVISDSVTVEVANSALGHAYGEATYTWSDDNSTCTAERVCSNDATHKETETVNSVAKVTQEQSCTKAELTDFTATFENIAFETQTKVSVVTKEIDLSKHTGTAEWTETATTHKQVYNCCGTEVVKTEAHEWSSGVCTECGYGCEQHSGGTATCTEQAKCGTCGQPYGEVNKDNHAIVNHEAKAATCTEVGWNAYENCSRCEYTTYQEIAALNHAYGEATYTWSDDNSTCTAERVCSNDATHKETETVTSGAKVTQEQSCIKAELTDFTATFKNSAFETQTKVSVVTKEIDLSKHTGTAEWTETATTHKQVYNCCGTEVVKTEAHEWSSGVCKECGYGCEHTGGEATCTEQAKCATCGNEYGELAPEKHTGTAEWIQTATTHKQVYNCCGTVVVETEAHNYGEDNECVCGHIAYNITVPGSNSEVPVITQGETIEFKSDADFSKFIAVILNGKELKENQDYTVREGSTIVTLSGNITKDLPDTNTITIVSEDGSASMDFRVEKADNTEYVVINLEKGKTSTATQNGLAEKLTSKDINVEDENIVSVTVKATKKTSGSSWLGGWFGGWSGSSNCKTTYDHTITFKGLKAGTTIVTVGDVSYKVTVSEPHKHSYTAVVTAPTCTEKGFTTYTCECGHSYVGDSVKALGHHYVNGVCERCNEPEPAKPEKPAIFAPKTFTASISKSTVNVGQTATITVKTSTDVEYVTINGEEVTKYTTEKSGSSWGWGHNSSSKTRVFTYTVSEDATGTYEYEVYAYNADDAQSKTSKTLKLKVKEVNGGNNGSGGDNGSSGNGGGNGSGGNGGNNGSGGGNTGSGNGGWNWGGIWGGNSGWNWWK